MTVHPFSGPDAGDHCPFIPVFAPPTVQFVRGAGTELWDSAGRRYLDFLAGIAVVSLGHAHPRVADAIARQAETLLHVSNFFANDVGGRAARMVDDLMSRAGAGEGQVFFCNSGAEANEAFIKLARKFGGPGRHRIVTALGSFHGRTLGALALTGQPAKHAVFAPMPDGFAYCPFGDLDALEVLVDEKIAGVLIEVVQGEGGVVPAGEDYLRGVERLCRDRGILFGIDEVQTGFCRTGRWFAFEHSGVRPDAVTLAKAMGNGMPVGALWARRDVASVLEPGDHGSTYSGTALATAAVIAVIEEMERIDACGLARERGSRLRTGLEAMAGVASVRGEGLLLGAVLARPGEAREVASRLLERGLIVNPVTSDVLRFAPPLTVSEAEIDEALLLCAGILS